MQKDSFSWDDLYVAYRVAEVGTLSQTAEQLGVNHSTVLRRLSRLEQQLGVKLFIRHQRGYRLTDAGQLMRERMQPVADEMLRLQTSLTAFDASPPGTLRISTVSDFSLFFAPLLHDFREQYPQTRVQLVATDDKMSLASGDVHVAIRMGQQPQEPDLIARKLLPVEMEFYAADRYIQRYGMPASLVDVNRHQWVLPSGNKRHIPGIRQLLAALDSRQIVFESNSFTDIHSAVSAGMGIGPVGALQRIGSRDASLQQVDFGVVMEPSYMWFVYHKDMRGSGRIQALQKFIVERLQLMAARAISHPR
ncbi:LysR family transcriptional regulator [Oceanobacter sp. 3_MG-2023]|uniref:LysR family transcriptional regulator n=1 Tax=Oceanobacter sp. 3_MG-2023 TaxID=3062622 RepID=UPI002732F6F9|nr:LysR family transcriptional regulator [Oceanobacter sp. 3_MG-2023]MDP2504662.1 LysR family transcriptional regulator [Oceanobacter sp. 3_MG-2023]